MPGKRKLRARADDFAVLARLSAEQQATLLGHTAIDPWEASPFAWIRMQPPARKGAIGVALVRGWAESAGLRTGRASHSDHDLTICGLKIEVKLSTLWASGVFKFQQLRDQDYEHLCLLGLEPQAARLWTVPKLVALQHARGQHTGAK